MSNQNKLSIQPGENIKIASVLNFRDLGGWATIKGRRVRSGLLYRSAELDKLCGDDMEAFARFAIRSIYDLRTEFERSAQPDRLPPRAKYIVVDVLKNESDAAPARLMKALSDPKAAVEMLGGGRAVALFEQGYRRIVSSPGALEEYGRFFSNLLDASHLPALFHCTTGKDRTGWAAASLLTMLGVSEETVMHEYLLTNEQLLPPLKPLFDHFKSLGGDPELLMPIIGVKEEYLKAAFDEMHRRFGTAEMYFAEGLGINTREQEAFRRAFLS